MDHRKIRRLFEAAQRDRREDRFYDDLREMLAKKALRPSDFSLRQLFEQFVPEGREILTSWSDGGRYQPGVGVSLQEAGDAVTTGAFANITGQIVYSEVLAAFESEEFVFSRLIPTTPTQFNGEKIAGIARIGDEAQTVPEGAEYPLVGVSEDWIETPETVKRGMILPLTKEAIFFDRTGLVLQRGGEVGEFLGLNKEKRAVDCVIDENTTAHRFKWRGTTYATYQTTSPWDNVTASNALVDWTDIDAANQTMNAITDPNTGEPVLVMANTIVVTKELEVVAQRIRNATEVVVHVGGYATSGNLSDTKVAGNLVGPFDIVTSRLLAARAATDTTWLWGDPRKAFRYMENWPLAVVQAPTNNHDEFHKDIAMQWKASERGAYATIEPRVMVQNTA